MKKLSIVLLTIFLTLAIFTACDNTIPTAVISDTKANSFYQDVKDSTSLSQEKVILLRDLTKGSIPGKVEYTGSENDYTIKYTNYTPNDNMLVDGSFTFSRTSRVIKFNNLTIKEGNITYKFNGKYTVTEYTQGGNIIYDNYSLTIIENNSTKLIELDGNLSIRPLSNGTEDVSFYGTYNKEKLNFTHNFTKNGDKPNQDDPQNPGTTISKDKAKDVCEGSYNALQFISLAESFKRNIPTSIPGVAEFTGDDKNYTVNFTNYIIEDETEPATVNGSIKYETIDDQGTIKVTFNNFEAKGDIHIIKASGSIKATRTTTENIYTVDATFENFVGAMPIDDGYNVSLNCKVLLIHKGFPYKPEKITFNGTFNGEELHFSYSFEGEENQPDPNTPTSDAEIEAFITDFLNAQGNYIFSYAHCYSDVNPNANGVSVDSTGKRTFTNYEFDGCTVNGGFSEGESFFNYDNLTVTKGSNTINYNGKIEFYDDGNRLILTNLSITENRNGSIVYAKSISGNFTTNQYSENEAYISFNGTCNGVSISFSNYVYQIPEDPYTPDPIIPNQDDTQIPETKVSKDKAKDVYEGTYNALQFIGLPDFLKSSIPNSIPGKFVITGSDTDYTISFNNYLFEEQEGESLTINGNIQYSFNNAQDTIKVSYTNFEVKNDKYTMKASGAIINAKSSTTETTRITEATFKNFVGTIPMGDGYDVSLNGKVLLIHKGYHYKPEKITFNGTYNGEELNFSYTFADEENQPDPNIPDPSTPSPDDTIITSLDDQTATFMDYNAESVVGYFTMMGDQLKLFIPKSIPGKVEISGSDDNFILTLNNHVINNGSQSMTLNGKYAVSFDYENNTIIAQCDNFTMVIDDQGTLTISGKITYKEKENGFVVKYEKCKVDSSSQYEGHTYSDSMYLDGEYESNTLYHRNNQTFSYKGIFNDKKYDVTYTFSYDYPDQEELHPVNVTRLTAHALNQETTTLLSYFDLIKSIYNTTTSSTVNGIEISGTNSNFTLVFNDYYDQLRDANISGRVEYSSADSNTISGTFTNFEFDRNNVVTSITGKINSSRSYNNDKLVITTTFEECEASIYSRVNNLTHNINLDGEVKLTYANKTTNNIAEVTFTGSYNGEKFMFTYYFLPPYGVEYLNLDSELEEKVAAFIDNFKEFSLYMNQVYFLTNSNLYDDNVQVDPNTGKATFTNFVSNGYTINGSITIDEENYEYIFENAVLTNSNTTTTYNGSYKFTREGYLSLNDLSVKSVKNSEVVFALTLNGKITVEPIENDIIVFSYEGTHNGEELKFKKTMPYSALQM